MNWNLEKDIFNKTFLMHEYNGVLYNEIEKLKGKFVSYWYDDLNTSENWENFLSCVQKISQKHNCLFISLEHYKKDVKINSSKCKIIDESIFNQNRLIEIIDYELSTNEFEVVVINYYQLLDGDVGKLKTFAQNKNICIILTAHLSRRYYNRTRNEKENIVPQLDDFFRPKKVMLFGLLEIADINLISHQNQILEIVNKNNDIKILNQAR